MSVIITTTKLITNNIMKICRGPESGFLKQKEKAYKNNKKEGP